MINGVNFGAITTDPTIRLKDETIAQGQAFAAPSAPSAPAAATNVQGDSFEKKGKGKKTAFALFATAAAALTGLALAVKKGKLSEITIEADSKLKDKALSYAHIVGKAVLEFAESLPGKITKLFNKTKEEAGELAKV